MRKKYRVALRQLLVYTAPVLLVLVFFVIAIMNVDRTMKQEAEARSEDASEFLVSYLEGQLTSLETTASAYLKNNLVRSMSNMQRDSASEEMIRQKAYMLSSDIVVFCERNNFARDVLLYFPGLDRIVGKNGYLTPYQYYKSLYLQNKNNEDSYDCWREQVLELTGIQFLSYADPTSGTVSAWHFQSTPVNVPGSECDCVLLLLINEENVRASAANLAPSLGITSLQMATEDGQIYSQWQTVKARDTSSVISVAVKSNIWRMSLETTQPLSDAYHLVYSLERMLMIFLLLAMLLALSICLYFFIQNARQLHQIRSIIPDSGEGDILVGLDWVAKKVEELYTQNRHQIEEIGLQSEMLGYALLHQLIYQSFPQAEQVEQLCNAYGISLEFEELKLLLIPTKKSYEVLQWQMHELSERWEYVRDLGFCWTMIEENVAILCNYSPKTSALPEFLTDVSATLEEKTLETESFQGPEEIGDRFAQLYADRYRRAFSTAQKVSEISVSAKFLDALDCENYKKARTLLPQLVQWAGNLDDKSRGQCARAAFLSQLYGRPGFPEKLVDQMYYDRSAGDWQSLLYEGLVQMSDCRKESKQSLPLLARTIIEQEYANSQLGLAMIAERLHISQSYLSRIFKAEYGAGIATVLNQTRIEAAKAMMLAGDNNLKEIALAVGFTSDMSFIRVFKKYESVTPGNYRKSTLV